MTAESVAQGNSAPEIILDVSRLLSRVLHPTPTGIDRVEMAYARALLDAVPDRLSFAAVHPSGRYGRLPRSAVLSFLDQTERLWSGAETLSPLRLRLNALAKLFQLRPRRKPPGRSGKPKVYLQPSPHHLDKPAMVSRILDLENARFVCLVHDLIPIEYPEYARPDGAERHKQRIDTLGLHADALIANSAATRQAILDYLAPAGRVPPVAIAHLGTYTGNNGLTPVETDTPYFVCIGTIEPRKNHLLLLNLWRRMVEERRDGATIPKLVLIGRRGWENENIVDMLDRCPALRDHIVETKRISDGEIDRLLLGARALLLPSFAEGYGMPVAEALAIGVPVLCSDIAALREVGGDVPEYLDPIDGPGWLAAIRDYTTGTSSRRTAQQARMAGWSAPGWREHIDIVLKLCAEAADDHKSR